MTKSFAKPKRMILKSFLALLMMLLCTVGGILTTPYKASAASTNASVSLNYLSGYYFNFNGLGLSCGNFSGQASMIKAGSSPAYCIQLGEGVKTGSSTFSDAYNRFSPEQKMLINWTLIYGYRGSTNYGHNANAEYYATQILCWIIEAGYYRDLSMSDRIADAAMSTCPDRSPIRDCINKMREQIDIHATIPSFMGARPSTAPTYEMEPSGNGKYSITMTDNNGVASYFDWSSYTNNGITVSITENDVTFSSNTAIPDGIMPYSEKVRSKYIDSIDNVTPYYFSSSSSQDLVYAFDANNDPIPAYMKLKTSLGHINIVKRAEDGKVSGLKFRIQGDGVDQTVTTGSDGAVLVENLVPADYTVTEVDTPSRYVQPKSQTLKVESGKTTQFSFSNVLKKVQMNVTKTDKETGTAQGDASLDGARYGMYNSSNDKLIDPYVTAGGGKFQTKVYNCADLPDRVYFQEIAPSEGYLLDTTKYYVDVAPGNFTVELNPVNKGVVEQVKKGDLKFIKMTDLPDPEGNGSEQMKSPEAGAKFRAYLKSAGSYDKAKPSERNILTTDEYGYAEWLGIPYGTYRVEQIEGTEGHSFIPAFDVVVTEDGKTYFYLLENPIHRARVKIIKKDAETGKTIPVSGTGFQVLDKDKKVITQTVYYPTEVVLDTFYTNELGELMLPEMLVYGDYYLKEVQAPDGYVLSKELLPFSVKDEEADTVTVEFQNMPQKGSITVKKDGDVPVGTEEEDGLTAPVFDLQGLAGAEFTVTAVGDIVTPDGTVRNKDGDVVGALVTGEDGTAKLEGLYLGTYDVQETKAPEGFVLNDTIQRVTLSYAGQEVEVLDTIHVGVTNDRQQGQIDFCKVLEVDELTGIGLGDEYQEVRFGLYAAEDIYRPGKKPEEPDKGSQTDPNGDDEGEVPDENILFPQDTLLQVSGIDKDGNGSFVVQVEGEYYIREIAAHGSYFISEEKFPVTFTYAGDQVSVVFCEANDGNAIENILMRGTLEIKKQDEEKNPLSGALFQIYNADKTLLKEGLTDEKGIFRFEKLPAGSYYYAEHRAPEGYVTEPDLHPFEITEDGQVITAVVVNRKIVGSVEITKSDVSDGELLPDTGIEILDKDKKVLFQGRTDENGVVTFPGLDYGDYYFREFDAPKGYIIDETPYPFSIKENGEIVKCTMTNQAKIGTVELEKPKDGNFEKTGTVKTGDRNPLVIIAMILASVGAAGVGYYLYKRRKELREQENLE